MLEKAFFRMGNCCVLMLHGGRWSMEVHEEQVCERVKYFRMPWGIIWFYRCFKTCLAELDPTMYQRGFLRGFRA